MKKTILIFILFLCGCSNKLICNYKTEFEDIKINNEIVFNFDTGSLEQTDKMIFEDIISASKYYSEIEEYKDEYNLKLEDNIIISKLTDEIKLYGNKEKIKEQYESYNYKCK